MRKAYTFRLYPTKKQEEKLCWTLNRCRELYNAALSERRDAYRMAGKSISSYEQKRDLPEIKEIRPEYNDIHSQVLQDVLLRLQRAFDRFFERVKNGEKPGYPRFQGRNRYSSFTYPQSGFSLEEKHLTLSKIGTLKVKVHRTIEGAIKTCTIKHESGQWYVIFSCEVKQPEPLPVSYEDVGIDLGITHFAALSNGDFIDSPRHYRQAEKKLKKLQEALSRKKRGSHRRKRAVQAIAKAHRKVRNQRRDFAHKASHQLVQRYQTIVLEELQTKNLLRRPKPKQDEEAGQYLPNGAAAKGGLNKSITDAGWGMFTEMLRVKAAWAGRVVAFVDPKYTSQVCSGCGTVKPKTLEERWHSCECGCELDRDTNAARNILKKYIGAGSALQILPRGESVEAPAF
ncbi:putative transposase [Thermosporothrix hazakensis]|jgi:putative transposase|uniref:Putative transposase n=1 Tax=Thermosporothrix hazakensis TaxID=644383 RepID=A0A326UAL0_THEHA|nr:RNA-guided endonuclease TnpB family protein [Thermosporothrix hazakensis]PZW32698.1 putative transposase [Thermosporothrix hazakensis]GCE50055.1 transposase [Thermosporothrix hazakensis]